MRIEMMEKPGDRGKTKRKFGIRAISMSVSLHKYDHDQIQ